MARFVLFIEKRRYVAAWRHVMEKKLMELYELIATEHDPQELRELILRLGVLLEAKEQESERQRAILNTTTSD
jgi:hypothetical protein